MKDKNEPHCPICGKRMKLHKPRPGTTQSWTPYWGCVDYPECKGIIKCPPAIKPNEDDVRWALDCK